MILNLISILGRRNWLLQCALRWLGLKGRAKLINHYKKLVHSHCYNGSYVTVYGAARHVAISWFNETSSARQYKTSPVFKTCSTQRQKRNMYKHFNVTIIRAHVAPQKLRHKTVNFKSIVIPMQRTATSVAAEEKRFKYY